MCLNSEKNHGSSVSLNSEKIIEVMCVKIVKRTQKFSVCLAVIKIIEVLYVKTMNEHHKF